jgi:hypothetical protein
MANQKSRSNEDRPQYQPGASEYRPQTVESDDEIKHEMDSEFDDRIDPESSDADTRSGSDRTGSGRMPDNSGQSTDRLNVESVERYSQGWGRDNPNSLQSNNTTQHTLLSNADNEWQRLQARLADDIPRSDKTDQ